VTICDGRDGDFDGDCGIENIVTIDTDRHGDGGKAALLRLS